MVEKYNIL